MLFLKRDSNRGRRTGRNVQMGYDRGAVEPRLRVTVSPSQGQGGLQPDV